MIKTIAVDRDKTLLDDNKTCYKVRLLQRVQQLRQRDIEFVWTDDNHYFQLTHFFWNSAGQGFRRQKWRQQY